MPPHETRTDSPGDTLEVPSDPCQHWRIILSFRHRLHTRSRPWHRWERNPVRPSNNSHGEWPFLRPPDRVPEVPVISREYLSQLEKMQEVLPSRRDEAQMEPRFRLLAREEGSFPCEVGKEFPAFPSHLKRRRSPQERREELQGRATLPESTRCLRPFQANLFSLHCLDFQAEDRLTTRWHVGQTCGKASWESLAGKPQIP